MTGSPWLSAIRPKTMTAAFVPVLVGTALAAAQDQPVSLWIASCALLSAIFIQIATNLFNDAIDHKKGADTHARLGPARVTASGQMREATVLRLASACLALALFFGVPVVVKGGVPFIAIGLISLFLTYGYTGGPFPLAYLGFGDIFVVLFFGLIAVGGSYFLQTHTCSQDMVIAGLQVGFLATVLIAVNNLRDVNEDTISNKKTLPVRFGKRFAKLEIAALLGFSFILLGYWWATHFYLAAILPLVTWPFAYQIARGVFRYEPGVIYNQFLAKAAFVHLSFGILLAIGFWLS